MRGNCRVGNVVYKCFASSTEKSKKHVYVGVAEVDCKQRYCNHTMSFRNQKHKSGTALSPFLWELKTPTRETPKLKWSALKVIRGYSNISKQCLSSLRKCLPN